MARHKSHVGSIRLTVICVLFVASLCSKPQTTNTSANTETGSTPVATSTTDDTSSDTSTSTVTPTTTPTTQTTTTTSDIPLDWDESTAPNYALVYGAAVVTHDDANPGTVYYSDLDSLGRATGAWSKITVAQRAAAKARGRETMPDIDPTGWVGNKEVYITLQDGTSYHGYFWNRSHLVADSLGGDAIEKNLVTGTRMQNVGDNSGTGGMAFCEHVAYDWLETASDDAWLYYAATPVYEGNDLVCRAIIVDMKSSDGAIDERVIVYNTAKGYTIDYATGSWQAA